MRVAMIEQGHRMGDGKAGVVIPIPPRDAQGGFGIALGLME
jgi:hypothetical protein